MPFAFNCRKCGNKIFIRYLNTGEKAQCKTCGQYNIVPGDEYRISDNDYDGLSAAEHLPMPEQKDEKEFSSNERDKHKTLDTYMPIGHVGISIGYWGIYNLARMQFGWAEGIQNIMIKLDSILLVLTFLGVLVWMYCFAAAFLTIRKLGDLAHISEYNKLRYLKPELFVILYIILIEILNVVLS